MSNRTTNLLLTVLLAAMIIALPFAVPSGAILEEAHSRYVESTPIDWDSFDDYDYEDDFDDTEGEGGGGSMAPEDWTPPATVYSLPIELSPGPVPSASAYSDTSYVDESICVTMETHRVGEANYHVARVKISDPSQFRTALAGRPGSARTAKASVMAANNNAVVAMNGDYYGNRNNGYIIRQSNVIRKALPKSLDTLFIDAKGDFHIVKGGDTASLATLLESDVALVNSFSFGPALVIDGELQEMPDSYSFNIRGLEPRSAIGQIGPLEYLLLVVDGRRKDSEGALVADVAQFMLDMGCVQAFNMDGGNTAVLLFNGDYYSSKTEGGERSISDIIYFATTIE